MQRKWIEMARDGSLLSFVAFPRPLERADRARLVLSHVATPALLACISAHPLSSSGRTRT